eukprot:scaffold18341_cov53-Phaeocystis_antarctica.AAC.1
MLADAAAAALLAVVAPPPVRAIAAAAALLALVALPAVLAETAAAALLAPAALPAVRADAAAAALLALAALPAVRAEAAAAALLADAAPPAVLADTDAATLLAAAAPPAVGAGWQSRWLCDPTFKYASHGGRSREAFLQGSRARMGRGQGITCACVRGEAGMPPGHVQCASVRGVTATGAPLSQATPVPPTGSARAATVRAAAVRTGGGSAPLPSCLTANNGCPSR